MDNVMSVMDVVLTHVTVPLLLTNNYTQLSIEHAAAGTTMLMFLKSAGRA